jgi:hypothetical protein
MGAYQESSARRAKMNWSLEHSRAVLPSCPALLDSRQLRRVLGNGIVCNLGALPSSPGDFVSAGPTSRRRHSSDRLRKDFEGRENNHIFRS